MKITDIIWFPSIVEKLSKKHGVERAEVEEVVLGSPLIVFIESGLQKGEDVYNALGRADSGRYLIIAFIRKPGGKMLILSARDMVAKEKKRYAKTKY